MVDTSTTKDKQLAQVEAKQPTGSGAEAATKLFECLRTSGIRDCLLTSATGLDVCSIMNWVFAFQDVHGAKFQARIFHQTQADMMPLLPEVWDRTA
jgi:hypothetical protein